MWWQAKAKFWGGVENGLDALARLFGVAGSGIAGYSMVKEHCK
jgi:hypothetical protein